MISWSKWVFFWYILSDKKGLVRMAFIHKSQKHTNPSETSKNTKFYSSISDSPTKFLIDIRAIWSPVIFLSIINLNHRDTLFYHKKQMTDHLCLCFIPHFMSHPVPILFICRNSQHCISCCDWCLSFTLELDIRSQPYENTSMLVWFFWIKIHIYQPAIFFVLPVWLNGGNSHA